MASKIMIYSANKPLRAIFNVVCLIGLCFVATKQFVLLRKLSRGEGGRLSIPSPDEHLAPVGAGSVRRLHEVIGPSPPGWRRVAELPIILVESSCVFHKDELWCCGGYQNDRCCSFSPITEKWTRRQSLPQATHHLFNSFMSLYPNQDALLLLGGITSDPDAGVKHIQYLDTSPNTTNKEWVHRPDVTDLDLGGMISCTVLSIDDWHYCHIGTDPHHYIDESRFYAFNVKTFQFRVLTVPPDLVSHAALVADPTRGRVLLLGYRSRSPVTTHMGLSSRDIHYYDIASNSWNEVDPVGQIDERMPALEARAFYHHQSTLYGYLAGGQNNGLMYVSDLVYKFTLSPDPSDRAVRFERWSRLPRQGGFGAALEEVPPGSGKLMYVGGSKSVGAFESHEVFVWDQSRDPSLRATELERHPPGTTKAEFRRIQVELATYGFHDVTEAVQKLVDEGWTEFKFYIMPDLGVWEESQWKGGWKGHIVTKNSTGKSYLTGTAIQMLMLHIREPDGRLRMHICATTAGCKFIFTDEEEQIVSYKSQWEHELMPFYIEQSPPKFIN